MIDTSQIVTPFNALWSHNVVHNFEHATFNVDCCYYICSNYWVAICPRRHKLNLSPYHTRHSQRSEICYDYLQTLPFSISDKTVVL